MNLRQAAQQALEHVQEFKRRWMAVPPFGNKVNKATRESVSLAHTPIFQLEAALRTALSESERKPLMDAEIDAVMPYCHNEFDLRDYREFARAIERAHGIGGEA